MGWYRRKPTMVEAHQWTKHGDHSAVEPDPAVPSCGFVETRSGRADITPGDYLVREPDGQGWYVVVQHIFERVYEQLEERSV